MTIHDEDKAIRSMLHTYEQALNDADTEAVMQLYADDGVFMPQNFPSSVGSEAVRQAYKGVFEAIRLTVTFAIEEVQVIAPEWAFVRTNSSGTVLIHATGATSAEANQELFLLRKAQGDWKIARYCFSTTNPPRA
jgi:uncharacterized protein (TIGR02246 family)